MILVHMAEANSLVMILLFGASRFHPSRSRKTLQNQRDLVFELALYTIPEVMFSTYGSELLNPDMGCISELHYSYKLNQTYFINIIRAT
ncbi:AGAP001079-PA [Anopheles gambiae str. PEST]|uniref:AGAP001078-PA n=2 Tax=Anopheles gambiae TaxID=7165 RepID=A0NDH5_ANOGA|nr:AGAP001078-PA [Anopheles gambiae str. PEST]EAU76943.1 AGAP001079-PA [Anopheles gambiae str. PEST]